MNRFSIEQGDALELMKKLPDESIDAVITDPPYGINYNSNRYKNGNPFSSIKNDHLIFFPIDEMLRVLRPTGALFAFYSFKRPVMDERIKNSIVWVKNNWSAGDLNGDFGNQYEQVLFIPREKFRIHSKRYSNVWAFDKVPATELVHPTQKPLIAWNPTWSISQLMQLNRQSWRWKFDPRDPQPPPPCSIWQ